MPMGAAQKNPVQSRDIGQLVIKRQGHIEASDDVILV